MDVRWSTCAENTLGLGGGSFLGRGSSGMPPNPAEGTRLGIRMTGINLAGGGWLYMSVRNSPIMFLLSVLMQTVDKCPQSAYFFGTMGIACAMIFCSLGSAYGIAKSGVGISSASILRPEQVIKFSLPAILAAALPIYGIVVAIALSNSIPAPTPNSFYPGYLAFHHLAAGLVCGFSGLAAGLAIGIAGDAGVRASAQQPKMYVGMALILIFAEALGLFGLIIAVALNKLVPKGFTC